MLRWPPIVFAGVSIKAVSVLSSLALHSADMVYYHLYRSCGHAPLHLHIPVRDYFGIIASPKTLTLLHLAGGPSITL